MGVKFEVSSSKPREIEFPCILEWKGSGKNVIVLFHECIRIGTLPGL